MEFSLPAELSPDLCWRRIFLRNSPKFPFPGRLWLRAVTVHGVAAQKPGFGETQVLEPGDFSVLRDGRDLISPRRVPFIRGWNFPSISMGWNWAQLRLGRVFHPFPLFLYIFVPKSHQHPGLVWFGELGAGIFCRIKLPFGFPAPNSEGGDENHEENTALGRAQCSTDPFVVNIQV